MFKNFLSLSLVFVMMFAMSSSIFADDSIQKNERAENALEQKKFDIDNIAPVIGEFEYDPEYAKIVEEKEKLAERYYQAKLSRDIELASELLSELDKFGTKSTNISKDYVNKRAKEVYRTSNSCPWYLSNGNSYNQFRVPKYFSDKTDFYYGPYLYGKVSFFDSIDAYYSISTSKLKAFIQPRGLVW